MSHDFSLARPQKRKKINFRRPPSIITAYNPTKAKITVKTFPLVENAFSMFPHTHTKLSGNYMFDTSGRLCGETYRFQNTRITAQHFSLSRFSPGEARTRKSFLFLIPLETFLRLQTKYLRIELCFMTPAQRRAARF